MSYESTLLLCTKAHSGSLTPKGPHWAQVYATAELGKTDWSPGFSKLRADAEGRLANVPERFYVFGFVDDDTEVSQDSYGKPLLPLDIDETIQVLEAADVGYHLLRFAVPIAMLRAARDRQSAGLWPDLLLLHYGH